MFCYQCGSLLSEDFKFCTKCGVAIGEVKNKIVNKPEPSLSVAVSKKKNLKSQGVVAQNSIKESTGPFGLNELDKKNLLLALYALSIIAFVGLSFLYGFVIAFIPVIMLPMLAKIIKFK